MENDELSKTRQVEESSNERNLKFYGVALPLNYKIACNGPLVFTKLCDVREILGKFKGARFCTFKNIDEAVHYALQPLEAVKISTPKQKIYEKRVVRPFRDFFVLHSLIRVGDVLKVNEFIWKHPNSLWNCGGIPSMTVGNIEFNALQAAVNHNYPLICQLILDTFEEPKFLKLIFPGKPMAFISRMMDVVIKMYLNSGSQSTGDTPLHYASKYGFIDCCKVLLADPLCNTTVRNHDGLTPEEIICACADEQIIVLKEDIQALFTDSMLYVPVFRSENNLPSFIGSPIKYKDLYSRHLNVEEYKNASGSLLKAFAGPMSLEKAELFYEGLKNPSSLKHFKLTRLQKSMISNVNVSDPEKGIERIGRRLADFLNIEWKEYFSAFNVFTNLCQKKGLRILEDCLRKCRKGFHYSGPLLSCNVPKKEILSFIQHYPPHLNPLNHQVNQLLVIYNEFLQVPVFDEDEEFRTPPSLFPESPMPLQSVGAVAYPQLSSSTLFLNGSSYSSSDKEVFIAVKDLDVPSANYPEICKWRISMASYLRNSLCANESLSSFELNLSRPLAVARPYEVDSTPRKRHRF
ncbi:ankyrin repeat and LEM domain-containing protein 2 [Trichonephila clavata]|uniref:Ankyrin repeat and LEM domain-containing protein 2 n=1 Tax=Trichonephila clavata TaxID=2740835 RepID=A0A8X6ILR1_TRICU|nr:ankyrin repeat and LEM domain-containing protein 2 [Trichonephila clavata]